MNLNSRLFQMFCFEYISDTTESIYDVPSCLLKRISDHSFGKGLYLTFQLVDMFLNLFPSLPGCAQSDLCDNTAYTTAAVI